MNSKNKNISDIFLNYKHVISGLLSRITATPVQEIEDILQETFVRVYQSSLKQEIRFPKAFMVKTALRIAKHQKVNKISYVGCIEDSYNSELILNKDEARVNSLDVDYIKHERFELLCQIVNELPVKCRKVMIMKKIYGLSQREIAERLNISESTVEKHVASGVLKCHKLLKEKEKQSRDCEKTSLATEDNVDIGKNND